MKRRMFCASLGAAVVATTVLKPAAAIPATRIADGTAAINLGLAGRPVLTERSMIDAWLHFSKDRRFRVTAYKPYTHEEVARLGRERLAAAQGLVPYTDDDRAFANERIKHGRTAAEIVANAAARRRAWALWPEE